MFINHTLTSTILESYGYHNNYMIRYKFTDAVVLRTSLFIQACKLKHTVRGRVRAETRVRACVSHFCLLHSIPTRVDRLACMSSHVSCSFPIESVATLGLMRSALLALVAEKKSLVAC